MVVTLRLMIARRARVRMLVPSRARRDSHPVGPRLRSAVQSYDVAGQPRESAVALAIELDPQPRGVHRGLAGMVSFDGKIELARVERAVVERGGESTVLVDAKLSDAAGAALPASDLAILETLGAVALARSRADLV